MTPTRPRQVSGGEHEHGHLEEFRTDPIALMTRVRTECGDIGAFRLAQRDVILLSGAQANEFFSRSPRILRRTHHLHIVGLPHRRQIPRGARRTLRAPLSRAGARHRRLLLRRLGIRTGPTVGDVPQRPLEDGRATGAALRSPLPATAHVAAGCGSRPKACRDDGGTVRYDGLGRDGGARHPGAFLAGIHTSATRARLRLRWLPTRRWARCGGGCGRAPCRRGR
ncbi:MAG: cytochrome [Nocardia sp.]|nr:cytochrome [Nocardia sp.]